MDEMIAEKTAKIVTAEAENKELRAQMGIDDQEVVKLESLNDHHLNHKKML